MAEWMKNILVCALFFSLVLYMAPNEKMRRYIQTAVGLIMIIVVASPVVELLGAEEKYNFSLLKNSLNIGVTEGDDDLYVYAMEKVVENYVWDKWGLDSSVEIEVTDSILSYMEVEIQEKMEADENFQQEQNSTDEVLLQTVKENIASQYGVDEDKVCVIWGEDEE